MYPHLAQENSRWSNVQPGDVRGVAYDWFIPAVFWKEGKRIKALARLARLSGSYAHVHSVESKGKEDGKMPYEADWDRDNWSELFADAPKWLGQQPVYIHDLGHN